MMETILFSFILILIIIWIMLGILYFYMRYVSLYGIPIKKNKKGNEQTKENEATKEKDGQKGRNQPKSIVDSINKPVKVKEELVFTSGEEFEKARNKILKEGG